MHRTTTWRRRVAALLALPLFVLLAGCGKLSADVSVQDENTLVVDLDLALQSEFAQTAYSSPEEFCQDDTSTFGGSGAAKPEAYEKDGMWGCRIHGTLSPSDFNGDMTLTQSDGQYHLVLGGMEGMADNADAPELKDFDLHVTISFPGKVLESKGGEIDGKSVTYTDVKDIAQGIDITAEAGGGSGLMWIILGIVALLVLLGVIVIVAVVIVLVVRRRKKNTPVGGAGAAGPAMTAPGGNGSQGGNQQPGSPNPQQGWNQQSGSPDPQQRAGQPWGQSGPSAPEQHPHDGQLPPYRGPQG